MLCGCDRRLRSPCWRPIAPTPASLQDPGRLKARTALFSTLLKHGRHARNLHVNLTRQVQAGRRIIRMDSRASARRLPPSWLAAGRTAGAEVSPTRVVRLERRNYLLTRQLGEGRVRFPRWTATLWALPWTPVRLGGLGKNPEYAVKSTDRFLTSLSRIQIRVRDQRKVPLLKFWVRRSPRPPLALPPWAEVGLRRLGRAWAALVDSELEKAEKGLEGDASLAAVPAGKGSEQSRNVP
jgi:hypothetical protein